MPADDNLAQWATLFLSNLGGTAAADTPPATSEPYVGISAEAGELLRAVDAGGVPAFMTSRLKQIAADNEIETTASSTPNDIIDALRRKVTAAP